LLIAVTGMIFCFAIRLVSISADLWFEKSERSLMPLARSLIRYRNGVLVLSENKG